MACFRDSVSNSDIQPALIHVGCGPGYVLAIAAATGRFSEVQGISTQAPHSDRDLRGFLGRAAQDERLSGFLQEFRAIKISPGKLGDMTTNQIVVWYSAAFLSPDEDANATACLGQVAQKEYVRFIAAVPPDWIPNALNSCSS